MAPPLKVAAPTSPRILPQVKNPMFTRLPRHGKATTVDMARHERIRQLYTLDGWKRDWQIDGETITLTPEKIPEITSYTLVEEYDFNEETVTIRLYTRNTDTIYWAFGERLNDISSANKETNVTELVIKPQSHTKVTVVPANDEQLGEPVVIEIPVKVKYGEKKIDEMETSTYQYAFCLKSIESFTSMIQTHKSWTCRKLRPALKYVFPRQWAKYMLVWLKGNKLCRETYSLRQTDRSGKTSPFQAKK